jgi:hypothetical protein
MGRFLREQRDTQHACNQYHAHVLTLMQPMVPLHEASAYLFLSNLNVKTALSLFLSVLDET